MSEPHQDIIAKLKTARTHYINAIVRWRAAREEADAKLRVAEHELAQSLAELGRGSERVTQLRAG